MEADWEIEIGGEAPIIDAAWTGLVDLRAEPKRVHEIAETAQLPGLAEVLLQLNSLRSPVWTAKCDVWAPSEFDPDEMEADDAEARLALACYLDLLPRKDDEWSLPEAVVGSCKAWKAKLQYIALANCRVDFVIRRAWITSSHPRLGVTVYLSACGEDLDSAMCVLRAALAAVVDVVAPDSSPLRVSQVK